MRSVFDAHIMNVSEEQLKKMKIMTKTRNSALKEDETRHLTASDNEKFEDAIKSEVLKFEQNDYSWVHPAMKKLSEIVAYASLHQAVGLWNTQNT